MQHHDSVYADISFADSNLADSAGKGSTVKGGDPGQDEGQTGKGAASYPKQQDE